jgi:general stress protein 26
MKIEPQKSPNLSQIGQLLKSMSVCMLTNENDDGELVSRPMSPHHMCKEGFVWFLTNQYSNKIKHLSPINLAFVNESDATYVSLSGFGEVVIDRDLIEKSWTAFAKPWFPDGVNSKELSLLKFNTNLADYWDSHNCKMVRIVAMVASIVASKPIGMGEHGHIAIHE